MTNTSSKMSSQLLCMANQAGEGCSKVAQLRGSFHIHIGIFGSGSGSDFLALGSHLCPCIELLALAQTNHPTACAIISVSYQYQLSVSVISIFRITAESWVAEFG